MPKETKKNKHMEIFTLKNSSSAESLSLFCCHVLFSDLESQIQTVCWHNKIYRFEVNDIPIIFHMDMIGLLTYFATNGIRVQYILKNVH